MMRSVALRSGLLLAALVIASSENAASQETGIDLDTVRAGRYDSGKMWPFEYAPKQFFTQTYGFNADDAWFEKARLSALRIPGCSASFVSATGLIVTNHHCARGGIVAVARPGERLLDTGFVAVRLADERRIPGYYADQLIAIHDVSDEIFAEIDRATTDADRATARVRVFDRIASRFKQQHRAGNDSIIVQLVPLYAGGRYSAYVFRRFTDIRLVAAPEEQIGFFGGDADNFTYPRYDLDFSFLRAYDRDGKPLRSPNYFRWSTQGINENDVVFVIGNPGPTTRMNAVAQLEFIRDIQLPTMIRLQQARWDSLQAILHAGPRDPNADAIRNRMFSISNMLKAARGRLTALNDAVILAKRRDAERRFAQALAAHAGAQAKYGDVLSHLADVQQRKRAVAAQSQLTFSAADKTNAEWQKLLAEEREWNSRLGRARYEVYGTEIAPDATSSPRITDGVVLRYEYNGTIAPPYTTFYGMYDRHYSFGQGTEWDLPARWLPKPANLNLGTPLNFISTADTYGGNSGSPAVTKNLELVGLNFDRNINGLSRDYVYLPERGRNVMVDVRAIAESLRSVFNGGRILKELTGGSL